MRKIDVRSRWNLPAVFLTVLLLTVLTACGQSGQPTTTAAPGTQFPTATMPLPTETPLPTTTPTELPSSPVTATVWEQAPRTMVLTYHQFAANHAKQSTGLKVRFEDFESQLVQLYNAGFSLVSLEDWLDGNIVVPPGRRPLIFSMDDLYFNNQIRLDEEMVPLPETGIGILYRFSQEHPEFGFSGALFVTLGDKLYGNPDDPGWQMELAETIAWGMDHNLMPYNHTYYHSRLDWMDPTGILWELQQNDLYLRELLSMAGREDLIPQLQNIFALTYGVWPKPGDEQVLLNYKDPEGKPIRVIAEIDLVSQEKFLLAPFTEGFDPLRLPRHVASPSAVDYLVGIADKFPTAGTCDLGLMPDALRADPAGMAGFVAEAASERGCPDGFYVVEGQVFRVTGGAGEAVEIQP